MNSTTQEALSLVQQAEEIFRHGQFTPPTPADADSVDTRPYPDGYTRLSPVQPYRTPDGYYRRLALKAVLYAAAAFLLVTLIVALLRNGILRI